MRKLSFKPQIIDMADLELVELAKSKRLVVIAATWGEGEPPARATRAYGELMGEGAPRLDGIDFGVLALGDTAYAEFCAIGKKIDERLAADRRSSAGAIASAQPMHLFDRQFAPRIRGRSAFARIGGAL